jgi:CRISPR-associated protein Csm3
VFLTGDIRAVTGLHIGGATGALEIGGVDAPVIRDPLTGRPYVPGSSLRGKLRSLTEKATGVEQNFRIGKGVYIHMCETATEKVDGEKQELPPEQQPYMECPVCRVFGVTGDQFTNAPTRLVVRDAFLSDGSAKALDRAETDLPYSEIKWEAAIDRVTSAAVPRQIERVPADAVFQDFELVYSAYGPEDVAGLRTVVQAMQLLEDDYLGGLGSRGTGKIRFENLNLYARSTDDYGRKAEYEGDTSSVDALLADIGDVEAWARQAILGQ